MPTGPDPGGVSEAAPQADVRTRSRVKLKDGDPTGAGAEFPFRVAAVDIGSNAIRFTAAEFLDSRRHVELEYHRVPVRLGHAAYLSGRLDEAKMTAAVEAMASFRKHLDTHGIEEYRAVATSAVRESRNGGELVERVRRETGIRIETITGSEEARLVWLAVMDRFPLEGRWMLVDLGGGSLEVSAVSESGIEWTESHTMGTVRMLDDLGSVDPAPGELNRLLEEYANTLRLPRLGPDGPRGLIATGGNIEALAELAGAETDDAGVSRLRVSDLDATNERLASLTNEERIADLGLREDRADVIVPAGRVYSRVAELCGAEEIVVPHVGVKEGVLLDLVEDVTTHTVHVDRQEREIYGASLALGRRYQFDEAHARQVALLALSLFDQLGSLHGLGEADRRILLGAALLHDIGQYVSYRKHHKHSLYLIQNGELSVYSPKEIPLVALVARYHRRAEPKPHHHIWAELDQEDRGRVVKLASLLRVADSLDREHLQRVVSVRARPDGAALLLEVEGRGDLLLERWALEKKGSMFESTFGLRPRIVTEEG
jgi:exopolyphosphatase/guanosine-5'-triphosphate,3'-diphosphate pyrophosphatase